MPIAYLAVSSSHKRHVHQEAHWLPTERSTRAFPHLREPFESRKLYAWEKSTFFESAPWQHRFHEGNFLRPHAPTNVYPRVSLLHSSSQDLERSKKGIDTYLEGRLATRRLFPEGDGLAAERESKNEEFAKIAKTERLYNARTRYGIVLLFVKSETSERRKIVQVRNWTVLECPRYVCDEFVQNQKMFAWNTSSKTKECISRYGRPEKRDLAKGSCSPYIPYICCAWHLNQWPLSLVPPNDTHLGTDLMKHVTLPTRTFSSVGCDVT